MPESMSFPRRQARTRRFTLGAPRDVRVSADGSRVTFLRSSGPHDPANGLWVFDVATGVERLAVDPTGLGDDTDLPPAERARRERARETGGGIVGYDTDPECTRAVFAVGGTLVEVDLDTGQAVVLDAAPSAFDPRVSPSGDGLAYVAGNGLRVIGPAGDRLLVDEPDNPTVSWGSAEFVAGEEMGRTRGHWWSPDGMQLLVERVDVAPVQQWWIAAPVDPDNEPTRVRYPAAGTANAEVSLALIGLEGERRDVAWDTVGPDGVRWEYLADVRWTDDGLILTVQTRDQRTLAVLDVDPADGTVVERARITDEHWVELVPGVPRLAGDRLVTVEDRAPARRLCVDGVALTDDSVQVRRVVTADDEGVVVVGSTDPTTTAVGHVGWDGTVDWWTPHDGVHGATVAGGTRVITRRSLDGEGASVTVAVADASPDTAHTLVDHAADPGLDLDVTIHQVGERDLVTAIVLPSGADGATPLPVLLDPYGGPHAQRVQRSRAVFHTSQWFADQGFAVVITDGRGTPGRGPAFERAVRGDLAAPVLDDQVDALHAAAVIEPRLDLERVAIRGWSFGGYLAALAVLRRPDVFHAAVAGAPVTDWRLYDTHYTERYLGHPDHEPDNFTRTDLTGDAASLRRPLLLIHGLADDNVVAAHTLRLSRALLEAGRPHTVLPLSGVTHMTPQEDVAENLLLVQLAFLREALGLDR
jgi:dipeptidyl-peptidase-4